MLVIVFLKIKVLQILRLFKQIGVFRCLFLMLLIYLFPVILYKSADQYYLPILFFVSIYTYRSSRPDKKFIKQICQSNYLIYWAEYTLLSLLFIPISLIKEFYSDLFFYPIVILVAPFLFNIKFKKKAFSIPFFRKGSYEYQSMFRSNYPIIIITYIVSFVALYNENERVLYFCCFLSSIIWFSCLLKSEPLIYMLNYRNSQSLVQEKVLNVLLNFSLLYLPFFFISLFGGWTIIYTVILIFVSILSVSIGSGMLKYCFPANNLLTTLIAFSVMIPLGIMSVIYPWFVVLYLLLDIFIIFRALDKLDTFFCYDNDTTFK